MDSTGPTNIYGTDTTTVRRVMDWTGVDTGERRENRWSRYARDTLRLGRAASQVGGKVIATVATVQKVPAWYNQTMTQWDKWTKSEQIATGESKAARRNRSL